MDEVQDEPLSTYTEIVALMEALPVLSREKRRRLGLTLRAAADASGVPFNSIQRVETRVGDPSWKHALNLLRWIGKPDQLSMPPSPEPVDGGEGDG